MDLPVILPPGGIGQPGGAAPTTGGQNLGKEDFLLMLVTQLNNQDPLNPLEGHQFAAQLAQFTSVEQLLSLNQTLAGQGELFAMLAETMGESLGAQADMLHLLAESLNRNAATGLIGLSVEAPGSHLYSDGSTPAPVAFELDAPAAEVRVTLRDADGEVVHTFTAGAREAGRHELAWPGTDDAGETLPEGFYTVEIEARDAEGAAVPATTLMQGIVERVSFGPDGVFVWINGEAVAYGDVRSLGFPPYPEGESALPE